MPTTIHLSAENWNHAPRSAKQWKIWCELPKKSNLPGQRLSGIRPALGVS